MSPWDSRPTKEYRFGKDEFQIKRRKGGFKRFKPYFAPYLLPLAGCALIALLMNAATLAKPWIIKQVIDEYISQGRAEDRAVTILAFGYLGVVILAAVMQYLQTNFVTLIGQKIMFRIRNDLFSHIQGMSMGFFDRNSSGRLLTRLTNDVEALNDLFSNVFVNVFRDFILVSGIIILMFRFDVMLALVSLICIPLIVTVTLIYRHLARINFTKVKGMIARINGFLAENISGMRLVQIFHREKEKASELDKLDGEYVKYSLREVILNSFSKPVVEVINNLTISVLLVACAGSSIASSVNGVNSGALKVGVLYAFISYIKQLFEPVSALAEQFTSIQSALVSSDRILEVFENTGELEDAESGINLPSLKGRIEFRNVWFAYEGENWVLKDVSFTIERGQTVAFVGATGSGKSTVISLISRFYDIQRGAIFLDGRNIRDYNILSLRKSIAVVIQDVFLFSGDIKFNIRLNNKAIDDDRIKAAARYVSADRFIESLPGSYDEIVRERGCTFSAGQRQLISFARAVAFDPSVLVLDEATSNIDTETQQIIQRAMETIASGKTSIVIAHRLSTIRNADTIMVLRDGRLAESGTHEELLARKGQYHEFFTAQLQATPV
ncbi:ABC-type multidrug/protein/lipid transport system, ATPase component [Treponema primitia ZAS-2]|uniref:ABC-type multidrug/protein/lipid transport system, ATPase component n=2 Tax=Treponema primitia TaxID=88058 RepID=F5YR68_TREPZ|nr:ABC-type multidrug/protein/lipid transport system, ATPase component [Treponema primitia ZAS-2]